jgi:hypothetical protein
MRSIFHEDWWLDAVAPGRWGRATASDGQRDAEFPFAVGRSRLLGRKLVLPRFTPRLGPVVTRLDGKPATELSAELALVSALIADLPPHDYLSQSFIRWAPTLTPFHWAGYRQTTRDSYVLEDVADTEEVWSRLAPSKRRAIRKAEKHLLIKEDPSIDEALRVVEATYERQDREKRFDVPTFSRAVNAARSRGVGRLVHAVDEQDRTHGILFVVRDARGAYGVLAGQTPEHRGGESSSLLLMDAVRWTAATGGGTFDFMGSMNEGIGRFFRGFGAVQAPYSYVRGGSLRAEVAIALTDVAAAAVRRARAAWRNDRRAT